MTLNGGDPRTYKKVCDDTTVNNHQNGLSSSSNQNMNNTNNFPNQTNPSTPYTYSSTNITNKTDSFNRSSNDRDKTL